MSDHQETEEYRGFQANPSCPWMVIFPCGNRKMLDIAQVRDYEQNDWALASAETFTFEYDARDYMLKLAEEYGLRATGVQYYLDS